MLPAVSELLHSTFSEGLKKLQAWAVFVSMIFVLLNILFALPLLIATFPPFAVFLGLGTLWQTVIVGVIVLVLSYTLASTMVTIQKAMTGESWMDSKLGRVMADGARAQKVALEHQFPNALAPNAQWTPTQLLRRLERDTNFPEQDDMIGPTRLGNILNASAFAIFRRYGIDMSALWPHLEASIPEDAAIFKRVGEERSNLDFHLGLVVALYIFAAEYFLLSLWQARWGQALVAVVFVALGYLVYRSALGSARAWADAQEVMVDLHRDDLRTKLGLSPFTGLNAERKVWEAMSGWALWGNAPPDSTLTYPRPPPPAGPAIVCSPNIVAQLAHTAQCDVVRTPPAGAAATVSTSQPIDYVILVAAPAGTPIDMARGIYLVIQDSAAPHIDVEPVPDEPYFTPRILRGNADTTADALFWSAMQLPAGGARALRYTLNIRLFRMTVVHSGPEGAVVLKETVRDIPNTGLVYALIVTATEPVKRARLEVMDRRLDVDAPPRANFRWAGVHMPQIDGAPLADGGGCGWPLGDLQPGIGVLTFSVGRKRDG